MPTPRPFGAPTTWMEPSTGEVTRQVNRMRQAAQTPASQNFLQQMITRIQGMKPPTMPSAPAVKGLATKGGVLGAGLATGFVVADHMEKNSAQNVSTSGRGAGRAAFEGGNRRQGIDQPKGFYGPGGNPNGSGQDQAQRDTTQFGTPGINPRTGLPYSESPGKSSTAPETPATPEGRTSQESRTNELGVKQSGTNMGAINMPGLEDADLSGIANFNGPSFPTQAETNKITDGYSFTASEFLTEPKNADGSAYEAPGGTPETTNIAVNGNTFRPNTFAKGTAGDIGGLDGFKPGGKFAGAPTATEGQAEKANDTEFNGPDPMSYATSGEEMRRRSAFLDAKDSMSGMQNVAAGLGMGNQGLRNFANVDGKAVAMSSADRRAVLNAGPGEAQALKDKWVKALATKKEDEPQTASSAQNPTQPSGTSTFNMDEKLDLPKKAMGVDYKNNNEEDDFGFSQTGGGVKINEDDFKNSGIYNNGFNMEGF